MELQEPVEAMMVGSHVPPPQPKPKPPQITSTTLEAEGVCLGPQQLQELKALTMEWDEQRTKLMAEEDWHGLLSYAQYLFWASSILFRPAHLLCYLLAMHDAPALSETLFAKILEAGQKKSLEAAC